MLFGETLARGSLWDRLVPEFDQELDSIVRSHIFVVRSAHDAFNACFDQLLEANGSEGYDGGDAFYDAELELGINPWDLTAHQGLMALTRAISLTELTIARLAACWFIDPGAVVFRGERMWTRRQERDFFLTCTQTPIDTDAEGFGTLRDYRDLYVHGYGVPATESRRHGLAREFHDLFESAEATHEELSLGYSKRVFFFGEANEYSPASETLVPHNLIGGRVHADMSTLATRRLLLRCKSHLHSVFAALSDGVKRDLTPDNSRFVRNLLKR